MKYNQLGNTGLLVSELCFGTMTFGGDGRWKAIGEQAQDEADALLDTSIKAGINFIDTANVYSFGMSEAILGNSIKNLKLNRDELIVATKVRGSMDKDINSVGLSRYHIFNSVDASLERLQLDHIDLLYVHGVDNIMDVREIMRSLNDIVNSGKVRYIGVCNWPAWMVMKANGIARQEGWHEFKAMQYYYSLACRDVEDELIPLGESEGLGFMPWSPLAGGFLTGKYTRENTKSGGRRDDFDFPPIDKERAFDIVDVMKGIADNHDVSVPEIALAWIRQQQGVTSTIIGARTMKQLESNLSSVNVNLTEKDQTALAEVSQAEVRYPTWMVNFQNQGRTATVKPSED